MDESSAPNICALKYIIGCEGQQVEIKEITALNFQTKFLNDFVDLVQKLNLKIAVSLMTPVAGVLAVALIPQTIDDIHLESANKRFIINFELFTPAEKINKGLEEIASLAKIVINLVHVLSLRNGLIYKAGYVIVNSNTAKVVLQIQTFI